VAENRLVQCTVDRLLRTAAVGTRASVGFGRGHEPRIPCTHRGRFHYVAPTGRNRSRSSIAELLGVALVAWGGAQMILGTLAAQLFAARTAFLFSLTGALLLLGGIRLVKTVGFPLILLAFMFPIPAILYARITLPLQLLASSVAESMLSVLSIPVVRDGNILELASQKLSSPARAACPQVEAGLIDEVEQFCGIWSADASEDGTTSHAVLANNAAALLLIASEGSGIRKNPGEVGAN
jgi:hypothetical protein